jgi:hypothetical protein
MTSNKSKKGKRCEVCEITDMIFKKLRFGETMAYVIDKKHKFMVMRVR